MLPRIEAVEQLSAIEAHAMASGSSEDAARTERFDRLKARARGEMPVREEKPRRKKLDPDALANMGIGMTIVPAEGAAHG